MGDSLFKISKGVNLQPQASVPGNAANGDMYYDSVRDTFVQRISGQWRDLQSRSDVASSASLTSAAFTATVVQSTAVKITGSTSSSIHGLAASANAKMVLLYNATNTTQSLKHQSGTEGTAANRIISPTGGDIVLNAGESAQLMYDSAQSRWIVVSTPGSGDGSGFKNLLTALNSKFEGGVADWITYDDTAGLTPVDGTGGSPAAISISATTSGSEVLEGLKSLKIAKSAADGQGEGASVLTKTIDRADRGKPLFVSMSYDASHANFIRGDLKLFAYDVTNSQLLAVINSDNNGELFQQVGKLSGVIFTQTSCTQIRLILHCTSTNALAYDVFVDEVLLTPQSTVSSKGGNTAAWLTCDLSTANDLTGTYARVGTTVTVTAANHGHRVGHIVYADFTTGTAVDGLFTVTSVANANTFTFTHGTSGATSGNVSLKRILINDSNGIHSVYRHNTGRFVVNLSQSAPNVNYAITGTANNDTGGTAMNVIEVDLATAAKTVDAFYMYSAFVNTAQNHTFDDIVNVNIVVTYNQPTAVMTANEAGLQTAMAKGTTASTASISAANPIPFATEVYDNYQAYNPTTGQFTAPTNGYYRVHGAISNSVGARRVYVYVGGVQQSLVGTGDTNGEFAFTGTVYASVGQTIDIRPVGGSLTINDDSAIHFERIPDFNVFGVQGPTVVGTMTDVIDAGPIVLTSTAGTAPTKGTVSVDKMEYKQIGDQMWCRLRYKQTVAGTNGSAADYLYTLPNGAQFAQSVVRVSSAFTSLDTIDSCYTMYGTTVIRDGTGPSGRAGGIVPYDDTRFRVFFDNYSSAIEPHGSDFYGYGSTAFEFAIEFMVPIQGWSSQTRLYPTQRVIGTTYLKDVKANTTDGGTATSGSYQTRVLNTQEGDTGFCSLASNQFTLQPGTYEITAVAAVYAASDNKARIQNITDATTAILGMNSSDVGTASLSQGNAAIMGRITITAAKVFELQHRVSLTNSGDGWGRNNSFGDNEVYALVKIDKIY